MDVNSRAAVYLKVSLRLYNNSSVREYVLDTYTDLGSFFGGSIINFNRSRDRCAEPVIPISIVRKVASRTIFFSLANIRTH